MTALRKNHCMLVPDIFGCASNTKGEVGLELETIGKRLPEGFVKSRLWNIHNDDSVKVRPGEMSKEYVLAQPVGRPKIETALDELHSEFKLVDAEVAEGRISNSVHVHINAQTLSLKQVYTWLALYFIFEELLVRWAGPERVGNLFCLRAKDAEGLIRMLSGAAKKDAFGEFSSDSYRYASCNVMALSKYGSLEFRALRGTADKKTILTWVETLLALKDKSLEYKDPVAVLADFSQRSPIGFTVHTLPPAMRTFVFQQPDFQDSLYEGARLTQDFAFATQWSEYVPSKDDVPVKTRSKKTGFTYTNPGVIPGWTDFTGVFTTNLAEEVSIDASQPPPPPPSFDPYSNHIHPDNIVSFDVIRVDATWFRKAVNPGEVTLLKRRFLKREVYEQAKSLGYRYKFRPDPAFPTAYRLALVRASDGAFSRWAMDIDFYAVEWAP